ncbi:MAG: hypothetical protein IKN09_05065 [Clostridia bacterium]|nr:hypothetical protein [Clostridia bacterium]MBR4261292.1 hypothetical protein [Clostridia bacterium]
MDTNSMFSQAEIKTAENALRILAHISAEYWLTAIISNDFVLNGQILDYERGYKDRVQKVIPTDSTRSITMDEALNFKKTYLDLINAKIDEMLQSEETVAAILGQKISSYYSQIRTVDFGGWDNSAMGLLAEAMHSAGIKGVMHYGSPYRRTRVSLFFEDGAIRNGFHKCDRLMYSVR